MAPNVRVALTQEELPRRPVLSGAYYVVELSGNKVQVCNAGRRVILCGEENGGGQLMSLLGSLDGETTLEELEKEFSSELVASVLAGLSERGLLSDGAGLGEPVERWPQLTALSLSLGRTATAMRDRLAQSTVALVGCGPVGCTLGHLLSKAGVGRLRFADDAVAAPSSTHLYPLLSIPTAGVPLRELASQLCSRLGDSVCENASLPLPVSWLETTDLALVEVGYDDGSSLAASADQCLEAGAPYLPYSQDGFQAIVGPVVTGGSPCHWCYELRRQSHLGRLEEHLAYRRQRAAKAPRMDVFLAAHSSMIAGFLATEATRILIGEEPMTAGRVVVADFDRMALSSEELFPMPGCAKCRYAISE